MANRTKVTDKKKREFIDLLRETGNVSAVCRQIGVSRRVMYEHRHNDPVFREEWEEWEEEESDAMEKEAYRRAVDGVLKPVFYQGEECGYIREYSDTLLIFKLKGHKPEKYKDRTSSDSQTIDLTKLSDDQLTRLERGENIYSVLRAS